MICSSTPKVLNQVSMSEIELQIDISITLLLAQLKKHDGNHQKKDSAYLNSLQGLILVIHIYMGYSKSKR